MIIFLYGEDSYRRLKKQLEIENVYEVKYGNLSKERFDLSDPNEAGRLRNFLVNRSMFEDMKFAVLDNLFEAEDEKNLKEYIKNELDSKESALLITADKKPPVKFKFLTEKPVQAQAFAALSDIQLNNFIIKEAERLGLKLSSETVKAIKDLFAGDTWGIITELEKLSLSSNRDIQKKRSDDYFSLVSSLKGYGDFKRKLSALEIILSDRRDDPARVFNSLSYRLSNKKEAEIFADYDVAVKSGKLDYEEILLDFILS